MEICYNNSQWDPIRGCARKIKCSWMHLLKMLLRCINAVGCVIKRHAHRCIHKMQAILSVVVWVLKGRFLWMALQAFFCKMNILWLMFAYVSCQTSIPYRKMDWWESNIMFLLFLVADIYIIWIIWLQI